MISFKAFLVTFFFLFVFKSAMRGFTSELISLGTTILSSSLGIMLYKPKIKSALIAVLLFGITQCLGIYLAIINKRFGILQVIGGIMLGVIKFFLLLVVVVAVSLITNLYSNELMQTDIVQFVLPYAEKIKGLFYKFA